MRKCAYCNGQGKLTREHVFPNFLQRRQPFYRTFVDRGRDASARKASPTVRDVCATCNNGPLSVLDSYGQKLFDKYFSIFVDPPINLNFRYNYHALLRWLLKLSYNDGRTHHENTSIYRQLIPYILGSTNSCPFATSILVGIIEPSGTTPDEQTRGLGSLLYPKLNRFANLNPPIRDSLLGRLMSMNSYLFVVIVWKPRTPRPKRKGIIRQIATEIKMTELNPLSIQVRLKEASIDTRRYILSGRQM